MTGVEARPIPTIFAAATAALPPGSRTAVVGGVARPGGPTPLDEAGPGTVDLALVCTGPLTSALLDDLARRLAPEGVLVVLAAHRGRVGGALQRRRAARRAADDALPEVDRRELESLLRHGPFPHWSVVPLPAPGGAGTEAAAITAVPGTGPLDHLEPAASSGDAHVTTWAAVASRDETRRALVAAAVLQHVVDRLVERLGDPHPERALRTLSDEAASLRDEVARLDAQRRQLTAAVEALSEEVRALRSQAAREHTRLWQAIEVERIRARGA